MKESVSIVRLSSDYQFKPFDCGNQDLNDFLLVDAKEYAKRLLSVTYVLEMEQEIVAYFSVSNDRISIPDSDKATWRKIKDALNDALSFYIKNDFLFLDQEAAKDKSQATYLLYYNLSQLLELE